MLDACGLGMEFTSSGFFALAVSMASGMVALLVAGMWPTDHECDHAFCPHRPRGRQDRDGRRPRSR